MKTDINKLYKELYASEEGRTFLDELTRDSTKQEREDYIIAEAKRLTHCEFESPLKYVGTVTINLKEDK